MKIICIVSNYVIVLITFVTSQYDPICIHSTINTRINGKYEYSLWDNQRNGPIYYNAVSTMYLYPWIFSNGNKAYLIHQNITNSIVYSGCDIPSSSNPMSPFQCFNDNGQQLKSFDLSGVLLNEATATILPCSGTII